MNIPLQTTHNWQATLLLLATAMIWDFAFVAQRQGMKHMSPFTFNGARFAVGAVSLLPILLFFRRSQTADKREPWFSKRFDPLLLSLYQFLSCATLSRLAALQWKDVTLAGLRRATLPIFYTGVFSVGIAYTLQVVTQKRAHPAHAAIIISLESVFAVLGGWLIIHETLSLRGLIGCGLMLIGMLVSQLLPHNKAHVL
ncbi:MAG: DMT family transporter [Desulfocapsa sp.]|nr:DMT family transporter [Desulfocapsa sp.]